MPIAHDARPESARRGGVRRTPPPPRTPGPHVVNFFALDGSVDLTVAMGKGSATLTGGNGGWVEEQRRGLPPALWWDSPTAYRQSIPIRFKGSDVEGSIQALQLLSGPDRKHPRTPPPLVAIAGPAIWRADLTWVIEGVDPGSDVLRREDDGHVQKHDFVVKLVEYNGIDALVDRSPSRQAAGNAGSRKPPRSRSTWRVRQGDNLRKIAVAVYGDDKYWKAIANANGIRDGRTLKVGRVLKIPNL